MLLLWFQGIKARRIGREVSKTRDLTSLDSTLRIVSGNPLFRFTRDCEQRLEVIETEGAPVAPFSGLVPEWAGESRREEGPFSLWFCQIVALMFPHRSVFAGLLLVTMMFPPLWK